MASRPHISKTYGPKVCRSSHFTPQSLVPNRLSWECKQQPSRRFNYAPFYSAQMAVRSPPKLVASDAASAGRLDSEAEQNASHPALCAGVPQAGTPRLASADGAFSEADTIPVPVQMASTTLHSSDREIDLADQVDVITPLEASPCFSKQAHGVAGRRPQRVTYRARRTFKPAACVDASAQSSQPPTPKQRANRSRKVAHRRLDSDDRANSNCNSAHISSQISVGPLSDREASSEWEQDWESEVETRSVIDLTADTPTSNLAVHQKRKINYKTRQSNKTLIRLPVSVDSPEPPVRRRPNRRRCLVIESDSAGSDHVRSSTSSSVLHSSRILRDAKHPRHEIDSCTSKLDFKACKSGMYGSETGARSRGRRAIKHDEPEHSSLAPISGAPLVRTLSNPRSKHAKSSPFARKDFQDGMTKFEEQTNELIDDSSLASISAIPVASKPIIAVPVVVVPQLSTPEISHRSKPFKQNMSPICKRYPPPPIALSPMFKINGIPLALGAPHPRKIRGRLSLATSSARRDRTRPFPLQPPVMFEPNGVDDSAGIHRPSLLNPSKVTFCDAHHGSSPQWSRPGGSISLTVASRRSSAQLTPKRGMKGTSAGCRPRHVSSPHKRGSNPAKRYGSSSVIQEFASLLHACDQSTIHTFTDIVTKPPLSVFGNGTHYKRLTEGRWTKLAEATFSEVFGWSPLHDSPKPSGSGNMESKNLNYSFVMKVVPIKRSPRIIQQQTVTQIVDRGCDEVEAKADEFPCETEWAGAEKEIKLARLLGSTSQEGFVNFRGARIVSGPYPRVLLKEWKKYQKRFPDKAYNSSPGQAGEDLESFDIKSWREAASVLLQVARTLSRAERDHEFEHRDLHWGNITVLRHEDVPEPAARANGKARAQDEDLHSDDLAGLMANTTLASDLAPDTLDPLSPMASKIAVTILDFGLSRARLRVSKRQTHTIWTDPESDLFGGTGAEDYQFECYDLMDAARNGKSWSEYNPISNVIWLHYLSRKLLEEKGLSRPRPTVNGTKSSRKKSPDPPLEQNCFKVLQAAEQQLSEAVRVQGYNNRQRQRVPTRRSTAVMASSESTIPISAGSFLDWWDAERLVLTQKG